MVKSSLATNSQARARPLRDHLISAATLRRYQTAVLEFHSLCLAYFGYNAESFEDLDSQASFILEIFWQDFRTKAEAANLLCGLQHFLNRRRILTGSWRLYQGWDRVEKPRRSTPLPLQVLAALCGVLVDGGHQSAALCLAISFAGMLRTCEFLRLCWEDLHSDGARITIALANTKIGVRRGLMEYVTIDDMVLATALRRFQSLGRRGRLLESSERSFRQLWASAMSRLQLPEKFFQPYSIRRGGATASWIASRNITSVLFAGRWSNSATARAYVLEGEELLLTQSFSSLQQRLLIHFQGVCTAHFQCV